MSWHPNDLVADVDLRDYEESVMSTFGMSTWQGKRTKALEDWLFPILRTRGFDPHRLRTRYECDEVLGYTGSAFTTLTSEATDATEDNINLATVFATAGSDRLFIGSNKPFRGVFLRMADSVSAVAAVLSAHYWNGNWEALQIADGTMKAAGAPFSGGGSITWLAPVDWMTRKVNGSSARYWVRLATTATPTGAKAGQIGVIRASCLRAPATFRTLQLIFVEAPASSDGPWREKADSYRAEADAALTRALEICGGEFDTDASDLVSQEESEQTTDTVGGGPVTLERG